MSKTTIVKLNNKTRKGLYIRTYINGKTRYYKPVPGMTTQQVIDHYKQQHKNKQKGQKPKRPKPPKQQKKITKIEIEKQLKPGIITLTTTTNINKQQIRQHTQKLLNKSIKNKKLAEQITNEHNLQKISHRFEHTVTIIGTKGETLATITKTGTTPQKAIKEIDQELQTGDTLDTSPGMRDLNGKGWQGQLTQPGTIQKILIKTTFRKRR